MFATTVTTTRTTKINRLSRPAPSKFQTFDRNPGTLLFDFTYRAFHSLRAHPFHTPASAPVLPVLACSHSCGGTILKRAYAAAAEVGRSKGGKPSNSQIDLKHETKPRLCVHTLVYTKTRGKVSFEVSGVYRYDPPVRDLLRYGNDADADVTARRDSTDIVANVAPTAPKTPAKIFSMVLCDKRPCI